jgi:ubiquinone biosynthesis protein
MNLTTIPQFARNANRLREIVTVLSKYGLADWIGRLHLGFAKGWFRGGDGSRLAELTRETRIRLALSDLGPTFIKLGQLLSTRSDLIGPALAEELSRLQDNAPADAEEAVRATVEAELGEPIEQLFAEFEPQPLASASIAQVHRARLKDGTPVAVKVQHPAIQHKVRVDLDILVGLAGLAENYLPELAEYRPRTTAAEFQRVLLRELDFGREERNLRQFATHFHDDPTVRFPRSLAELSTSRVLTMEFLDGVKIADADGLRVLGLDREQLARRGAEIFLEMIFRDGYYHADPHPGNILVFADGTLGLLDCGMVGYLDEATREDIGEMLLAIANHDAQHVTSIIMRVASVPPGLDPAALSLDVVDFLSYHAAQPLDQVDLGAALTELTEIIRRHHLVLPMGIALLLKVLVMLEGTSRLLSPHFNLTELIQAYQHKLLWRHLSPRRRLRGMLRLYREWKHLGETLPRAIGTVLQQMQRGKVEVQLEHRHIEPALNRLVLGILINALILGSALLWSFQAPPLIWGVSLPGVSGCVLSVLLALRLLWTIRKHV